jgi:hypothetical protein
MEDYNFQKAREAWGDGSKTAKPDAIQYDKDGNEIAHWRFDPPAPTQEPYGYFRYDIQLDAWVQNKESTQGVAFYTAPPKREWVGLTEEDIYQVIEENIPPQLNTLFDMAKWVSGVVEAKLKEKNK